MKRILAAGLFILLCVVAGEVFGHAQGPAQATATANSQPQYSGGKLIRPEGYREWVYMSSGLGMSYSASESAAPQFTNTFVPQWAYREFVASGKWPEKTVFVLEERSSETKGSINKAGRSPA
jgi:hypothetical protein